MSVYKFEFTDYCVDVDIAGKTFKLDCSSDTGDYMKKVSGEMRDLAASIENGEKTSDDVIAFGEIVINTLLGDGAAAIIFDGRKRKVSDLTDLMVFLSQTARQFQKERQKLTVNRAQRRAASKK